MIGICAFDNKDRGCSKSVRYNDNDHPDSNTVFYCVVQFIMIIEWMVKVWCFCKKQLRYEVKCVVLSHLILKGLWLS